MKLSIIEQQYRTHGASLVSVAATILLRIPLPSLILDAIFIYHFDPRR